MQALLILEAVFKLGVPILVLSWLLFSWLYREGRLEIKADRKATAGSLREMKKASKQKDVGGQNYIYDKWMWFGSGFYGLAALWTFLVMEMVDILNLILNFPGFTSLLADGFIKVIVRGLLNQLENIVSAFVWFNYWSEGSPVIWLVVAYFGYLGGIELARRFNIELSSKASN
ncbi:MAG: hypothetical protein ACI9WC_002010 [Arenicella sp.]|jgi:hypothetical protein